MPELPKLPATGAAPAMDDKFAGEDEGEDDPEHDVPAPQQVSRCLRCAHLESRIIGAMSILGSRPRSVLNACSAAACSALTQSCVELGVASVSVAAKLQLVLSTDIYVPNAQPKKAAKSKYEDKGAVPDDTPLDDPIAEKLRQQK